MQLNTILFDIMLICPKHWNGGLRLQSAVINSETKMYKYPLIKDLSLHFDRVLIVWLLTEKIKY